MHSAPNERQREYIIFGLGNQWADARRTTFPRSSARSPRSDAPSYEKSKRDRDAEKIADLEGRLAEADATAERRIRVAEEKARRKFDREVADLQESFDATAEDVARRRDEGATDRRVEDALKNGAACRVVSEGTRGRCPSPQGAPAGVRDLCAQGDGADALLGRRPPHAALRVQWMSLSSRWLVRSKSMWQNRRAVRGHAFSVLIRVSEC